MQGQAARHKRNAARGALARAGARALMAAAALGVALSACSGGGSINIANSQTGDPATIDYPIFYVKRTTPLNADGTLIQDDLRIMNDAVPGADLYMRAAASPSAAETNITSRITAGALYDVKDVDVSADGSMVVFAMRGPLAQKQQVTKPPSWRIYLYTIATDTLGPVINPAVDPDPPTVQDESPHFLPDGRIVFSTTRQDQSQGVLLNEHMPQFSAQDEARQEDAFVLEVMTTSGTGLHQITFNQSHDRDATVMMNGRVLWTRWDDTAGHDQMSLYSANPDGTDLELYYGADSHMTGTNGTVVEFSHPKEMQNGSILALLRQYTGTDDGGDLVMINGVQYVENNQSYPSSAANLASLKGPAQSGATSYDVTTIPGPSPSGRFNSASPLWDGTNRILVSWSECRLLDETQTPPQVVACNATTLAAANPVTAPPVYSVWMFDPSQNTLLPITSPVTGIMVTDVVATQPRPLPNIIPDQAAGVTLDQNLVNLGVGVIDIRSVYDFDGQDTANPNIATVANPGLTPVNSLKPRFLRLVKAVSIPDRTVVNLADAAFGASDFMREIMGYAPIEPDGSLRIMVPAQVAFLVSVLDVNARRIVPDQGVWLQLQPGEVVNCNGCHSPQQQQPTQSGFSHGRAGTFASAWAGASAAGVPFPFTYPSAPQAFLPTAAGQTMAEARMAWSCANDTPPCLQEMPSVNVLYSDVWSDPAQVPAANIGTPVTYSYTDGTNPIPAIPTTALCATSWSANCRVIINYPQHIQPLWDATRADPVNPAISRTCTQGGCHSPLDAGGAAQTPAGNLDLTSSMCSTTPQQLTSYCQLLFPHNIVVNMQTQSVGPFATAGSANGSTTFFSQFASNGQHPGWLNVAELRLISEWLDIGAQYFNNPFDPAVPVN
jgi:Hydrazine synthase alpha subunit middle domain